jgi:phage terminase large subunit-like protein
MMRMLADAAEKTEAKNDLVGWIKKNFYIPETKHDPILKGRIGFQPYQEDALREALSRDKNGNFKYSIIVWSDIKKSAKSTIAAAVNLARAWHSEYGEFYVIANDLKQADSRVAHYLRRGVQLNPNIKKTVRMSGYKIVMQNGSFIEAIPIDPSGEAGSNADQISFSELWGANEDAKQNMWAEMTIPPGKHGQAFRWIESYAGFAGESLLLYSLYDLGVKQGELLWPDRLYDVTEGEPTPLELYVNREAGMLCLWNTQPRCPWQTKSYYASEAQILPPNQFLRVHRNQWTSSTSSFVPIEWFDACQRTEEEWPKYDRKRMPMVVSMDAGVSSDNFGISMQFRHPEYPTDACIEKIKRWTPPKGGKIDFQGTDDDPGPELILRQWIKEYNVVQVCYDAYQLHDLASRLMKEGLTWFKAFGQGNDRLLADSQIRNLIRDRKLWHRGEKDLRDHVQNADAKTDTEDHKIRIVKRAEKLKIDLIVTVSMGAFEVMRLNL